MALTLQLFDLFRLSIVFKKENENSVVRKCVVNQPMLLLGKNVEKSEL